MTEDRKELIKSLIKSAASGDTSTFSDLAARHPEFLSVTYRGNSLLHIATHPRGLGVMRYLIETAGVSPDITNDGRTTPLMRAVLLDWPEGVEFLLDHEARVNDQDSQGETPLHNAVAFASPSVVRLLLDHGANPAALNKGAKSSLDLVADPEIQKVLDEHDARLRAKSGIGSEHADPQEIFDVICRAFRSHADFRERQDLAAVFVIWTCGVVAAHLRLIRLPDPIRELLRETPLSEHFLDNLEYMVRFSIERDGPGTLYPMFEAGQDLAAGFPDLDSELVRKYLTIWPELSEGVEAFDPHA